VTLSDLLVETRAALAGSDDPDLEARILVEHFTGRTRTDSVLQPGLPIPEGAVAMVRAAVVRRLAGEPVYRIVGRRPFHMIELGLSPETLEPRPDTEALVNAMVEPVRVRVSAAGTCRILDLGTGTGAIALALLQAVPGAVALGVDRSAGALRTAASNAIDLGLETRFATLASDWFERVEGVWDIIVSNPPYISSNVIASLDRSVRDFDPPAALDGGLDGLDAYRALAAQTRDFLSPGGLIGLEIGFDQKDAVTGLFVAHGYALVEARRDLGGNDRVLVFSARTGAPANGSK
jgi:release factor glutamine methyltransferase